MEITQDNFSQHSRKQEKQELNVQHLTLLYGSSESKYKNAQKDSESSHTPIRVTLRSAV